MTRPLHETLTREILRARDRVYHVSKATPLDKVSIDGVDAEVYLKREDLSAINAYKWRGAYNAISMLTEEEKQKPIIASSAGNHAQGVALAARMLGLKAKIFMPQSTPMMKQNMVKKHGGDHVEVVLAGDNYDQTSDAAKEEVKKTGGAFIHPFDNLYTIAGQATIADEIILSGEGPFDYAFIQIGGGGLAAGVATWLRMHYPDIKIIGVEGEGQASMKAAIDAGELVALESVDKFCDGTAVRMAGELTFEICKEMLDGIITVSNEEVCAAVETIWECRRVIPELSGAMSVAGLVKYAHENAEEIKGKKVFAVITGANMDFSKLQLISANYAVGAQRQKYLCFDVNEQNGSLLGLIEEHFSDVNIKAFQYGKVSDTEAWPVIAIEEDPEIIEGIIAKLDKNKVAYKDITGSFDTRYRIINYDPVLFQNPLFIQVNFPERSGALRQLLKAISPVANICYFNYAYTGETIGRAVMGFEIAADTPVKTFKSLVESTGVTVHDIDDDTLRRMTWQAQRVDENAKKSGT